LHRNKIEGRPGTTARLDQSRLDHLRLNHLV
jgi:hypothetical protein